VAQPHRRSDHPSLEIAALTSSANLLHAVTDSNTVAEAHTGNFLVNQPSPPPVRDSGPDFPLCPPAGPNDVALGRTYEDTHVVANARPHRGERRHMWQKAQP
jgi:hypothetical protein